MRIRLTEEEIGPFPVKNESLWFDKIDGHYLAKNIPLFVHDLSYDDLVSLREVGKDLYAIDRVLVPSKNSTVIVLFKHGNATEPFVKSIVDIGCGIEGGVFEGLYFSINVPERVDIDLCYSLIDEAEDSDILVADYLSIRH